MQNSLWDVAALRFGEAGTTADAPPEMLDPVKLLLGECLVRGGRPDEALEVLQRIDAVAHPDAQFWIGQALAGKGRFSEAVEALLPLASDPTNALQSEAAFTVANLQLSLDQPENALKTLSLLGDSPELPDSVASRLRKIAILIDLDRKEEARELFPPADSVPTDLARYASLLDGYLLLSEGKPAEAESRFASLLGDPGGQSVGRFNLAAIGLADSMAEQGDKAAAVESLFNFIQARPETTRLAPMFRRIEEWLPNEILSADHPVLVRLAGWIPKANPSAAGFINTAADTALAAWPTPSAPITDLEAFAIFTRSMALRRLDSTSARIESILLLQRLRHLAPSHFLAQKSLLTIAEMAVQDGEVDEALAFFDLIGKTATSPRLKGEAIFANAREAYRSGDRLLASKLFAEAAEFLDGSDREAAAFDSALAVIELDGAAATIQNTDPETAARLAPDLALEKALAEDSPEKAKGALDEFLRLHPEHPRAGEARLAIAEAALASAPPDLSLAQAQLDSLKAAEPDAPMDSRMELAKLRLLDLSGKSEETIAIAELIAQTFPGTSAASEASLILGKCLFRNGNYNEARLALEKLANSEPGTQRAQAALLLAARSAALGATTQSREEALALFDRTMAADGPLKALALIEKARLLKDLNRLPAAIESLRKAYADTNPQDPARIPTGILLAEAIYGRGDSDPASLTEALEIYDSLVDLTKGNLPTYFRIQYLRGLALEKIPDPSDPSKTRLAEARDAYFSVLDRPVEPPPAEWEWFERSGFRLLSILETTQNWEGAISIAEKIASFGGPRSGEAATRARQLRLKHLIWED